MTMKEAMWTQKEERKEGEEEPGQPVAKRQLQQGGVMSCDQPPASAATRAKIFKQLHKNIHNIRICSCASCASLSYFQN